VQTDRLEYITNQITLSKYVAVERLAQELGVSGETIRRDLKSLEEKGIVRRTHGGAYLEGATESDVSIQVRKNIFIKNKEQIAILCCQTIRPDDIIFLDNSTTSFEIAKRVTEMPLTVITNSLIILQYLSDYRNIRLMGLGGLVDYTHMCFTGKIALETVAGLYARKGFVSCRTVSERYGTMDSNEQIGQIRTAALKHSSERYLIADYTKFGATSLYKIADIESYDAIITDQKPTDQWLAYFAEREISVRYPEGVAYETAALGAGR
jgi:DeoR/GlpR family transcriptional regulator of sugar metabolism